MTDLIHPGAGLLFMKVGTHAQEPLDEIIARKTKEIEEAGVAFWGYGGNTCHPQTMVQPFAKAFVESGETIHLLMEEMNSKHFADQIRAEEFSTDGFNWETIHKAINVLGSRYALVIKNLHQEELQIPLEQTRVAVGRSEGQLGSKYIQGRVDKGCLVVTPEPIIHDDPGLTKTVKINLVADLVEPYAVFLRNKPN
jgi:hypothetical protein